MIWNNILELKMMECLLNVDHLSLFVLFISGTSDLEWHITYLRYSSTISRLGSSTFTGTSWLLHSENWKLEEFRLQFLSGSGSRHLVLSLFDPHAISGEYDPVSLKSFGNREDVLCLGCWEVLKLPWGIWSWMISRL